MTQPKKTTASTRREFLRKTGVGTLGLMAVTNLGIARSAHAAGSDLIKVALIGCGRRGVGSAMDRFAVGDNMKLVALADTAEKPAQLAVKTFLEEHAEKIDLPEDRLFTGFDAYKKAIECCDQVLIASPPSFHAVHYQEAIRQGKHTFVEKPMFVDAPGYRMCMEANKLAEEKNLTVCVGFQRRHQNSYREWVKRILDGEIGDVLSTRVYWNGGQVWIRGVRGPDESEMSFQCRDWYFFNWLSGDHIIEQHCHNVNIGHWIHGKGDPLAHPVSCVGLGGRQWRKTPILPYNECGNVFDHHYVEYRYEDGCVMHSQCRQIPGCWNLVGEKVDGTNGKGESCWLEPKGKSRWNYQNKNDKSAFVQEHINQVAAIREGTKLHDGWHGATSTMISVMGRMATYSGREIKWDEAIQRGAALFPYDQELSFEVNPPVMPGPDGTYEHAVAIPGLYNPFV